MVAFSTSMEEIHSPPDLITSLLRSVMRMKPRESMLATSPVLNQLCASTALPSWCYTQTNTHTHAHTVVCIHCTALMVLHTCTHTYTHTHSHTVVGMCIHCTASWCYTHAHTHIHSYTVMRMCIHCTALMVLPTCTHIHSHLHTAGSCAMLMNWLSAADWMEWAGKQRKGRQDMTG